MPLGLWRFRTSRLPRTGLLTGMILAVSGLCLVTAGGAFAVPTPTGATAHRQVATLEARMRQATEEYDAARERLRTTQGLIAQLRGQVSSARQKLGTMQQQADTLAATAYRSGNVAGLNTVLAARNPQQFIDNIAMLRQLSSDQRTQLRALGLAHEALDEQIRGVAHEEARQRSTESTLRAKKAAIQADLGRWLRLADAADAPARASRSAGGRRATAAFPMRAVPGSGRGAVALRFAMSQMGKPYSWGASGPGAYDCSGLTMASWRAAGVSLPHSSRMQYAVTAHVSRSQMRPGDLVFFYSPISHVAIFVGGDTVVGAPTAGDVVRYQSISQMGYTGSSRPG